MIDPTFKHKVAGAKGSNEYDAIIQARTAELHFDLKEKLVRDFSRGRRASTARRRMSTSSSSTTTCCRSRSRRTANSTWRRKSRNSPIRKSQPSWRKNRHLIATSRRKEAIRDGFAFASGRIDRINWGDVYQAFRDHAEWIRRCDELNTEWHLRISMAFGSLMFVLLGAPIGIRFARRDFLSAFMTCFLPIIAIYYPLMLGGTNMSKEGQLAPFLSLWIGNLLLAIGALFVLPSVVKH